MTMIVLVLLLLSQAPRTGIVEGRITNPDGTPAAGVRVAAQILAETTAEAAQSPVLINIAQTDSSGRYRLEGVPPGRYYIAAGAVYALTYHPGVDLPDRASVQRIVAGTSLTGVDFKLVTKPCSDCFTVRGVLKLSSDMPAPIQGQVTLFPALGGNVRSTFLTTNGSYEFTNVRPGLYRIMISSPGFTLDSRLDVRDKDVERDFEIRPTLTQPLNR
jgi:hypothetical protein